MQSVGVPQCMATSSLHMEKLVGWTPHLSAEPLTLSATLCSECACSSVLNWAMNGAVC